MPKITTVIDLIEFLGNRTWTTFPVRIEDQDGHLLGNVVTDVYMYHRTPSEPVVIIAIEKIEDDDESL